MLDRAICRWACHAVCLVSLLLSAGMALPQEAAPRAGDPALEARMMAIAEELRCLVCQNETLAASHASLAVDLREQIRQQLREGRNSVQVRDYMVQRYGTYVLYRPPFAPNTWFLWVGPFVLLAGALALFARVLQARVWRAALHEPEPLDPREQLRLDAALRDAGQGTSS